MNTLDALAGWEMGPLMNAISNVRCGAEEPGGPEAMIMDMELLNSLLPLVPELIAKALAYRNEELTERDADMVEMGAWLMLLVACKYGEGEKFAQDFPDMPKLPQQRLGSDGRALEAGLGPVGDSDAS